MTTKLNFESVEVQEVAVDIETRTITGLVLPYGVDGNTSGGKVSVDAGAIQFPSDLGRIKLLRDHNRAEPVGYTAELVDGPDGLRIKFKVGNTESGNTALIEAADRIRDGLSVELSAVQKSPDGRRIVSALLDAVALVAVPAFSDARVSEVKASEHQEKESEMEDLKAWLDAENQFHAEKAALTASASKTLTIPEGLNGVTKKTELTAGQIFKALEDRHHGAANADITAALADITRSANPYVSPVGFLGEVWDGVAYQREIVPLLTKGNLTSHRQVGWRWVVKPQVDDYAGDKTDIPSNSPTTEQVVVDALRLAGGHDLDRKFVDFGDTEFIASYFAAMAESYAFESDQRALDFITTSAIAGGAAEGLLKAVAVGAARVKKLTRAKATFVLVNSLDMLTLLDVTADDVPAFLALLGIEPSAFVSSDLVPRGQVLVGTKSGLTFYELPGSPIRVEAVSIANGGYDGALFGYYATLQTKVGSVVKVAIEEAGWTLDLTPASATIAVAATQVLTVKDNLGNVIPNDDVVFTTSNPARATVSANGVVTGVATGAAATITAKYQGKTDTAAITVS